MWEKKIYRHLLQQRKKAKNQRNRLGEKKDNWLKKLNMLYADIESWLNDFEKDVVSIEYIDKEMNEEHIGMYSARKMILRIASEQVVLNPVRTVIIGAVGRVDMIGNNGKVRFVLVPASLKGIQIKVTMNAHGQLEKASEGDKQNAIKEDWVWKIATHPPTIKYVEIDSDSFSDALLEVVGG